MTYRYTATDPRTEPGRYFYAPFEGPALIDAYHADRRAALDALARRAIPSAPIARHAATRPVATPGSAPVGTLELLDAAAAPGADRSAADAWLAVLSRKLEVARRLRAGYGADLRPADDSEAPADAYARFATLLAERAQPVTGPRAALDHGWLSTLLKAGDVLAWLAVNDAGAFTPGGAAVAVAALAAELGLVEAALRRGVPRPGGDVAPLAWATGDAADRATGDAAWAAVTAPDPASAPGRPSAPGRASAPDRPAPDRPIGPLALLAADTPRARAYLDLLAGEGLAPDAAIVVDPAQAPPRQAVPIPTPLFDAVTPLPEALAAAGVPATRLAVERFEDPAVLAALDALAPDLVVVAPPAGVLLAPAFFATPGRRYLHVHPGRLPAYRGSTPMYYELLAEGRLTATALFLDEGIDTGVVVADRGFAPPADLATIDGAFDPWMRAALLRDVLAGRAGGRALQGRRAVGGGRTYHVIHPVLRHVALLAVPGGPPADVPPPGAGTGAIAGAGGRLRP